METDFFLWNAEPYLFKIGSFQLRYYSLFFLIGFTYGFHYMKNIFIREHKNVEDSDAILTYMVFSTIIGARLGHCLFYDPVYYLSNPIEILMVWKGGLASHGGTLAILIALFYYSKRRPDQPYMWVLDRIVIPTGLVAFLIRLGNFFNSEILGSVSDVPWAVIFAKVDNQPRHPVMMYEGLIYLITFFFLHHQYKKHGEKLRRGLSFGIFMIAVFGSRVLNEMFKVKQASFMEGLDVSMGQLLSIPFILFGLYMVIKSKEPEPIPIIDHSGSETEPQKKKKKKKKKKK